jgi:hypothetical protein
VNTWNYRVNAIFTLLSTTMFILLGLNAATRPFLHQEPVVDIKMNQLLALYVGLARPPGALLTAARILPVLQSTQLRSRRRRCVGVV